MRLNRRKPKPLDLSGSPEPDAAAAGEAEVADFGAALPELPRVVLRGPDFPAPPSGSASGSGSADRRSSAKARSRGEKSRAKDAGALPRAYLVACVGGLLWAGCFIAFVLGLQNHVGPLVYPPFASVILAMLTVLPVGAMMVAAYSIRQAAQLAAETRRAQTLAEGMVLPATLAAARTGELMEMMRQEVERASAAAVSAHDGLAGLQAALAGQAEQLNAVAEESQRAARAAGETLERERERTAALAETLQAHAAELGRAVEGQTQLVAEASDLARSQLQEAEATLAARAAGVTAAAAAAGAAAQEAGEHLVQQTGLLDAAGVAMLERLRQLDAQLSRQHEALASMLERCSQDEDEASTRLETRRAQLVEAIAQARVGESELGDASAHSAELLQGLIAAASAQVHDLAAAVQAEQDALSQRALEGREAAQAELARAISSLGEAADSAGQRIAAQAEEVRRTADIHVQAAKSEVEQLGEVAFEAGRRANQAFDTRVNEARRLIEQAGALVEEAGQRSAARMEAGLREASQSVQRLTTALGDMDTRMAGLPEQTRARVEAMRAATDRGVVELGEAMRRLTEEAQTVDAVFQERVRRNGQALEEVAKKAAQVMSATPAPQPSPVRPPAAGANDIPAPIPPALILPASIPPASIPPASIPPDEDDDFVAPETLFQREAGPRKPSPAGPLPAPRDRKPAFSSGPPPVPQVFGRAAAKSERDDDQLLDTPLVWGARPSQDVRPPQEPEAERPQPGLSAADGAPDAPSLEPDRIRPRLKLTPTEADRVLKTVFDPLQAQDRDAKLSAAPGAGAGPGRAWEQDLDEWTWKDLLSSIDEAPAGDEQLAEQMIGEIAALGVDAAALLPRPRLEEIAASVRAGDPLAARESVRRLAPAAVRRLSRRVLVDKTLREQADRYVRHYEHLLRGSDGDDEDRASTLLSSDPGRAYLLLDAAVGDLR